MNKIIASLSGAIAVAALANFSSAAIITKTIVIEPGEMGERVITNDAKKGDKIVVNFEAADGYILTEAYCSDSEKLGWTRAGDFSFEVVLQKDLDVRNYHKTDFNGYLEKVQNDCPPCKNGGDVEDEVLRWDMTGLFKVLGDNEGVGSDLNRNPQASFKTIKPSPCPDGADGHAGEFSPSPARAHPATA